MQKFLTITKALSDESRVRILLSMRDGELCLCQIVELMQLAPSTLSKHLELLRTAGLIERRKQGRWHYFRLAGRDASPMVREALRWVLRSLEDERTIVADAAKLCCVRETDLKELSACYSRN